MLKPILIGAGVGLVLAFLTRKQNVGKTAAGVNLANQVGRM
jgi:hypothetical protein